MPRAARPADRARDVPYRTLAGISLAAVLVGLAVSTVLFVARPTPTTIAPDTSASEPSVDEVTTSGPTRSSTSTRSTTSSPAPGAEGPTPTTGAASAPGRATLAPAPRSVCPASPPPPGRGSLVLADLDGRGCRGPARIHGNRVTARAADGTVTEVVLDLAPGDQLRVADLDGTGRDGLAVYRPDTGEVFRFAELAGPGEAVTARGRASGRVGGTAVVVHDPDGIDRLEIRGGSPA
jgi:hypothetical protein